MSDHQFQTLQINTHPHNDRDPREFAGKSCVRAGVLCSCGEWSVALTWIDDAVLATATVDMILDVYERIGRTAMRTQELHAGASTDD